MDEQAVDDREVAVIELGKRGHLCSGTIQIYLQWVHRFRAYCGKRKLVEVEQLSFAGVRLFTRAYAGPRLMGFAATPVRARFLLARETACGAKCFRMKRTTASTACVISGKTS